jgi:hypothetical protein
MDKPFVVYVATGLGFMYLLTNFITEIEKDEGYPTIQEEPNDEKYAKYIKYDSIGRPILDVKNLTINIQKEAWNHSSLKKDFLSFYPDYDEMKKYIKERVVGEKFQNYLLQNISKIEKDFLLGKINSDKALLRLKSL